MKKLPYQSQRTVQKKILRKESMVNIWIKGSFKKNMIYRAFSSACLFFPLIPRFVWTLSIRWGVDSLIMGGSRAVRRLPHTVHCAPVTR